MIRYDDEQALINLARSGDREAFDRLWGLYCRAVRGYTAARVAAEADAESILNEAGFEVWRRIGSYRERWSFFTFVRYWTEIVIRRHFRAGRRWHESHVLFGELADVLPGPEPEAPDPPFDDQVPASEYADLLRAVFTYGGKPHHLLCFGFCKLIEGWGPGRVVAELSDLHLRDVEARLEADYLRESDLPEQVVQECFRPLREALQENLLGATSLRDYYGKNPEANVSDWVYKVRRNTFQAVCREKSVAAVYVKQRAGA